LTCVSGRAMTASASTIIAPMPATTGSAVVSSATFTSTDATPSCTVTAAPLTSTGTGTTPQTGGTTIPSGGSVTLLDGSNNPVTTVTVAGQGTYTVDQGTGVITFTPVSGFTGTASPVSYRVANIYGTAATGTYTPTVTVPPAPVAEPESTTGGSTQSTTVTVPPGGSVVLLDPHGTAATTVVVPKVGTYSLNQASGKITFKAARGFSGTAAPLSYLVTDAYGQSAAATYTVTVRGVGLAVTGSNVVGTVVLALLAVALGGRLVVLTRRRRTSAH
jgi:CshA-type fibril repeat protein